MSLFNEAREVEIRKGAEIKEDREPVEIVEAEKNNMLNLILNQIRKGVLSINDASIELGISKEELEVLI